MSAVLDKFHAIEAAKVIYDIHYFREGVASGARDRLGAPRHRRGRDSRNGAWAMTDREAGDVRGAPEKDLFLSVSERELLELAEKATPHRWGANWVENDIWVETEWEDEIARCRTREDAEFIAGADPTAISALLLSLEQTRAALRDETEQHEAFFLQHEHPKRQNATHREWHRIHEEGIARARSLLSDLAVGEERKR